MGCGDSRVRASAQPQHQSHPQSVDVQDCGPNKLLVERDKEQEHEESSPVGLEPPCVQQPIAADSANSNPGPHREEEAKEANAVSPPEAPVHFNRDSEVPTELVTTVPSGVAPGGGGREVPERVNGPEIVDRKGGHDTEVRLKEPKINGTAVALGPRDKEKDVDAGDCEAEGGMSTNAETPALTEDTPATSNCGERNGSSTVPLERLRLPVRKKQPSRCLVHVLEGDTVSVSVSSTSSGYVSFTSLISAYGSSGHIRKKSTLRPGDLSLVTLSPLSSAANTPRSSGEGLKAAAGAEELSGQAMRGLNSSRIWRFRRLKIMPCGDTSLLLKGRRRRRKGSRATCGTQSTHNRSGVLTPTQASFSALGAVANCGRRGINAVDPRNHVVHISR